MGVEKKNFIEIMYFHYLTYMARLICKNPCPGGHEIYNLGRPVLCHRYYILIAGPISKQRTFFTLWSMFQKFGSEDLITLMIRCNVICKVEKPQMAILALMGIYYIAQLPYPSQCSLALLFTQSEVLKDKGHEEDLPFMRKATKVSEKIQSAG